jgi:hypothetical protein
MGLHRELFVGLILGFSRGPELMQAQPITQTALARLPGQRDSPAETGR